MTGTTALFQQTFNQILSQSGIHIPPQLLQHPGRTVLVVLFMLSALRFLFNGLLEAVTAILGLVFMGRRHRQEERYYDPYVVPDSAYLYSDTQSSHLSREMASEAMRGSEIHHMFHDPSTGFPGTNDSFELAELHEFGGGEVYRVPFYEDNMYSASNSMFL